MAESFEDFSKAAVKQFGDKVKVVNHVSDLVYTWASQEKLPRPTEEELKSILPVVVPVDNKCPACGFNLPYSFSWHPIAHGRGQCSCDKAEYLLYRYVRDNKIRIIFYELVGF